MDGCPGRRRLRTGADCRVLRPLYRGPGNERGRQKAPAPMESMMKIKTAADLVNVFSDYDYMVIETGEIVNGADLKYLYDGQEITIETYNNND